eukprot:scaffold265603_cov27-Prasinocladus_malaysianus.AAC.1
MRGLGNARLGRAAVLAVAVVMLIHCAISATAARGGSVGMDDRWPMRTHHSDLPAQDDNDSTSISNSVFTRKILQQNESSATMGEFPLRLGLAYACFALGLRQLYNPTLPTQKQLRPLCANLPSTALGRNLCYLLRLNGDLSSENDTELIRSLSVDDTDQQDDGTSAAGRNAR